MTDQYQIDNVSLISELDDYEQGADCMSASGTDYQPNIKAESLDQALFKLLQDLDKPLSCLYIDNDTSEIIIEWLSPDELSTTDATESQLEQWKTGGLVLYSIRAVVSVKHSNILNYNTLSMSSYFCL